MDVAVADREGLVLPDLTQKCLDAYNAAQHLLVEARRGVSGMVIHGGRMDSALLLRWACYRQGPIGTWLHDKCK